MIKKYILPFFTFALLTMASSAQGIDSLEKIISNKNLQGTQRVDALNTLSRELVFVDPIKAAQLASEALQTSLKINYPVGQAHGYRILSSIYSGNGKTIIASEYLQRALKIFQTIDDSAGIANCYITMGHAFRKSQNHKEEVAYHKKALDIFSRMRVPDRIAVSAHNLGESYFIIGEFKKSRELTEYAIHLNDSLQNLSVLSNCYKVMGKLEVAGRNFKQAENYFKQVLSISNKLGPASQKIATIESMIELASIYDINGQRALQLASLKEAAAFSEKNLLPTYLQTIYTALIKYAALEKNEEHVLKYTNEYNTVSESVAAKLLKGYSELEQFGTRVYQFIEAEKQKLENENLVKEDRIKTKNILLIIALVFAVILAGQIILLLKSRLEQTKVKLKLKESEKKYRSLIEQASDVILIYSFDGTIHEFNNSACTFSGYSREEFARLKFNDLVVGELILNPEKYDAILQGETVVLYRQIKRKDGVILELEVTAKMLGDGKILAFGRDITERKNAEDKIRASEMKYRTLMKQAGDYILLFSGTGQLLEANLSAVKMLGYSNDEYKNMSLKDLFFAEDIIQNPLRFDLLNKGESTINRRRLKRKGGGALETEIHAKKLSDGNYLGVARDISERIKSEQLLRESEEKFVSIFKSAPGSMILSSMPDEKTLEVNNNFTSITGYSKDEALGKTTAELGMWAEPDARNRFLALLQTDGFVRTFEADLKHKSGAVLKGLVSGHIFTSQDKKYLISSFIDITERKKAEETVRNQKERYDELVNNIPVGVYKFRMKPDGSMSFEYISPRLCKMIGVKEEDAYRDIMNAFKVIHPDDFGRFIQLIQESFITKQNFSWEGRGIFDGKVKWMRIESTPKVLENGDILWDGIIADVTEQKKNEEKIRINEARLTKAQQIGKLGYWQQEINSNMIWGSEEARKIYGFSPVAGELAEDEVAACIPDIDRVRQAAIDLLRHNKKYDIEFQVNPADGSPAKYISAVAEIEKDEQGEPFRIMGVLKDITEYKKGEQQIIKEKDLSDSIINSLPGIFYLQEYSGKYLRWNKKFETVTGYDAGEIGELDPLDFFEGEEKAAIINKIGEVLANGSADIETVIITKSGKRIPYYLSGQLIEYEDKPCFIGVGVDIAERKIADDKLRSSEKARKLIMDSALDAIVSMDTAGFITGWTPQAEKIFGWKEAEVIGKTVSETIVPPGYRERHSKGFQQYLKTGKGRFINNLVEVSALNKEGKEFPVEMMITPISQDGTDYFCAFIRDITERKKAEEEIKKSNERFELISKATNDALWELNIQTNQKWGNESFYQLYGLKRGTDSLENLQFYSRTHPEDIPKLQSLLADAYQQKAQSVVMEFRFRMPDDSYKTFLDRAFISYDENGKPVRLIGAMQDITERKKAEEEIKKTNERFELVGLATNDAIWEWNLETNAVWGNEMHQQLYGLTMADPVPNDDVWKNRLHPEDQERVIKTVEEALASDCKSFDTEYRLNTENKGWMNVYGRTYIERNKDGKPIRILGSMMDITERKKAEELLRESEETFRRLFNESADAILLLDDTGFTDCNPAAVSILGYSTDQEIINKKPWELSPQKQPDGRLSTEKAADMIAKALQLGYNRFEWIHTKADGTEFPIEVMLTSIILKGKQSFFTIWRDITERKKAEEQIRISGENYSSLVHTIDGIVWEVDVKTFRFSFVSKQAERLLGYPVAQWLSDPDFWSDHIFEEDRNWAVAYCKQCTKEKRAHEFEYRMKTADGRIIWLRDIVSVVVENDEPVKLRGIMMDITERKKAEEEIKSANKQLRLLTAHLQNIREEERKRIGREIHDELGQQLTAIKMDVAWIDKKTPDESSIIKPKLKNIITLLDGSNQSVRKILSELRPGILEEMGLPEAMEWQNRQFTESTGVPVEFTTAGTAIKLPAEIATCIFRVYQESLTNIIRYAGANKVLTSLTIRDDGVIVTVMDDGKGFDKASVKNKKTFGILGMEERVLSLDGKFELVSAKGKGTKISISLPYNT